MSSAASEIFPYQEHDFDALAALYCRVWATAKAYGERFTPDDIRDMTRKLTDLWILKSAGRVVGFVGGMPLSNYDNVVAKHMFRDPAAGYLIDELGVEPELQGEGFGGRLLAHAMEHGSSRGFRTFVLKTAMDERNSASHLYARNGFQIFRDASDAPVTCIVTQRRLDGRPESDQRFYFVRAAQKDIAPDYRLADPRFVQAVAQGLLQPVGLKSLPCEFFYDSEGSKIFSEICDLEEYYPTRTEAKLLMEHAAHLSELLRGCTQIVELGPGDGRKTRTLLNEFLRSSDSLHYFPIDVAEEGLQELADQLRHEYPTLQVHPVSKTFAAGLNKVASRTKGHSAVVLWLGTSIGNLEPPEAEATLRACGQVVGEGGAILAGADLKKDKIVLERAYDDARGVTARFNLNLLARINRELDGEFDLAAFKHRAIYNEASSRVEMHLVSLKEQTVPIRKLQICVEFDNGEHIHTENSYKFSRVELEHLTKKAGLVLVRHLVDEDHLFSLNVMMSPKG